MVEIKRIPLELPEAAGGQGSSESENRRMNDEQTNVCAILYKILYILKSKVQGLSGFPINS